MGLQELMYGLGAVVLLAALIYGTSVAGKRRRSAAADAATRRNFDKA
ncbi:MAG: hypothetical protein Q7T81_11225 [Pseudolabrys sp.]|nr:hypothetical protein [Pseudolabrys sp.]